MSLYRGVLKNYATQIWLNQISNHKPIRISSLLFLAQAQRGWLVTNLYRQLSID